MKIIYVHHAERDIGPNHTDPILRQKEDITKLGVEQAELLSKRMSNTKITAIVTSPYLRCKHTAEIINKYHNLPIVEDERFNESEYHEEREHLLRRNMEAIDDIYKKYNDDDTILCVTSGINLTAFICYFYDIEPTNQVPLSQAWDISPISFTKGKAELD
jgi:broad specificity phosphatase PhoE